ncbi:MAG: hypothetical protein H7A01_11370 [Hahellaceae bacterium]|nr:hypothetical protein [Hahellaceae bacterium]MCP5210084.1 hypothetical protein [Hahellaceae bacterium]
MREFPKYLVSGLSIGVLLAATGCGGGGGSGGSGSADGGNTTPPPVTVPETTNADLALGGTVYLDEGVILNIQEGSGNKGASITAKSSGEPGAMVGVSRVVSSEFDIESTSLNRGDLTVPILVTLPVSASLVSTDADPMSFDVQVFNTDSGEWEWVDGWSFYDSDTQDVSFWTGHFSRYRVLHSEPSDRDNYERYRVNSSNFSVIYYESSAQIFGADSSYAPPTDAQWKPVGRGIDTSADISNYIEDLGEALEDSLAYYLGMTTSDGKKLFSAPAADDPLQAYVTYLPKKDSSGESKFGIMRIATSLDNYSEMTKTATHELAHVMSNQYYSVFGAAYNRWFFEATADLWTSRALKMNRDEQRLFFSRLMSTYLKVPLNASDEGSYYAAADFLYWLEKETGKSIAADVVAADYAKDLTGLNTLLTSATTDLSDYYTEYVLQASMGKHDLNVPLVERVKALDQYTAGSIEKVDVRHLSAHGFGLRGNFDVDTLLVVSTEDADVKTFSYLTSGLPVSDVADYKEAELNQESTIVIENFGKKGTATANNTFYQIAINATLADSDDISYTFESYVLVPPLMQLSEGGVDFTSGVEYAAGQAPLLGFNVYLSGQKLNAGLLPPDSHDFKHASIHTGSDVTVTVVDKKGNEWPKVNSVVATNWEMLVDLSASADDIIRCSRSESSVSQISSAWIPITVDSDGKVRFSHDWVGAYNGKQQLHIEGTGTYVDEKLRVSGRWTLDESVSMVLGSVVGYQRSNVGSFTLGGHFTLGTFLHDRSENSAEADASYTVYGYDWIDNEYVAADPVNYTCNNQHPVIDITDFRQK